MRPVIATVRPPALSPASSGSASPAPGARRARRARRVRPARRAQRQPLRVEAVVDDAAPGRAHAPGVQPGPAVGDHTGRRRVHETQRQRAAAARDAVPDRCVHDRDAQREAERQCGRRRHPVPRVHDVGPPAQEQAPELRGRTHVEPRLPPAHVDALSVALDDLHERPSAHRPHPPFPIGRQVLHDERQLAFGAARGQGLLEHQDAHAVTAPSPAAARRPPARGPRPTASRTRTRARGTRRTGARAARAGRPRRPGPAGRGSPRPAARCCGT